MKDLKPQTTAQRLLNLYRQYHVINGKWAALNPVFLKEASSEVLTELAKLPTGAQLAQHIKNLQSGKTARDSIDPALLPYNGMMQATATGAAAAHKLTEGEMSQLSRELRAFVPDAEHLERIKSLPFVKELGDSWRETIQVATANVPDLAAAWDMVLRLDTATELWFKASRILASTPSERLKAEIQADMFSYENYLPMFGQAGTDLLAQLKNILSAETETSSKNIALKLNK